MNRRSVEAVGAGPARVSGVAQLGDESAATSEDVFASGDAAGIVIRGGASRTIGYVTGLAIGLLAVPLMDPGARRRALRLLRHRRLNPTARLRG